MIVEYLNLNGYLVETDHAIYVFDFVKGRMPSSYLRKNKPLLFLVSSDDPEHLSQSIFKYLKTIVIPFDARMAPYNKVFKMGHNDVLQLGFAKITAYKSNKKGVSYYIEEDNSKIFYAGTLNNWHYEIRLSRKQSNLEIEEFDMALNQIPNIQLDVLIFPVNPVLEVNYYAGIMAAILKFNPKHVFPTQFESRRDVSDFIDWSLNLQNIDVHVPGYGNEVFKL